MEFVSRHEYLNPIVEDNNAMIESYIMIDPRGRFYQNSGNIYHFSRPILEVGVFSALNDIKFNHIKFMKEVEFTLTKRMISLINSSYFKL